MLAPPEPPNKPDEARQLHNREDNHATKFTSCFSLRGTNNILFVYLFSE